MNEKALQARGKQAPRRKKGGNYVSPDPIRNIDKEMQNARMWRWRRGVEKKKKKREKKKEKNEKSESEYVSQRTPR